MTHSLRLLSVASVAISALHCQPKQPLSNDADAIRALEQRRLQALVAGDTIAAGPLHAPDFQLINPLGASLSRADYLGGLASGVLDYLVWTPDSISVRMANDAAILRYTAFLSIVVAGDTVPLQRHWHTDYYENRNGTWQVVWSQATAIQ